MTPLPNRLSYGDNLDVLLVNVGIERMLGDTAGDVMNKITPADIPDPQKKIAGAQASLHISAPSDGPGPTALLI